MRALPILLLLAATAACGDDGPPDQPDGGGPVADAGPDAIDTETLTVQVLGTGFGMLRTNPAGIECPGTCTAEFPRGAEIVVLAGTTGTTFLGWGGACSGPAICEVVLDAPLEVTGTFVRGDGTCAMPYEIAQDGTYSGVMTGTGVNAGGCGSSAGTERVFAWQAPLTGTATATLTTDYAPAALYVRPNTCGGTEVACDAAIAAPVDLSVMWSTIQGTTYDIVVDSNTQGATPKIYTLTISAE
jgi:hypothetical protein